MEVKFVKYFISNWVSKNTNTLRTNAYPEYRKFDERRMLLQGLNEKIYVYILLAGWQAYSSKINQNKVPN